MKTNALAIVVMGVSGSGKSSVGRSLAAGLACPFLEGDAFHTTASIDKMSRGVPLDDVDRWPWLDRLGTALGETAAADGVAIAACSALRRAYRDRLRAATGCTTAFIHLTANRLELERRMRSRHDHYMPASLLDSQLALLEPTDETELAKCFDTGVTATPVRDQVIDWVTTMRISPLPHT